jgi:hypothetical protein
MAKTTPQQKAANARKRVKWIITIISILLIDLCVAILNLKVLSFAGTHNPMLVTLIAMIVIMLLFIILVEYVNTASEWVIKHFFDLTQNLMGRSWGIYFVFLILLVVIYAMYYNIWFNKNLFVDVWKLLMRR